MRIHSYSHHMENPVVASEDNLTCPTCASESETWADLVAHATSHGLRNLQPSDNPDFSNQSLATTNHNNNSLRKPHKCELCYKSFSSEDRLSVIEIDIYKLHKKIIGHSLCNVIFLNRNIWLSMGPMTASPSLVTSVASDS